MERTTEAGGEAPRDAALRQAELRLECLRLALGRSGANDPRPWRAIAEELHDWVTAAGEGPLAPPPAARGKARATLPRRRRG
jgi:hypothetical protein